MNERRFIRVSHQFDKDVRPKIMLIPIDSISSVMECLSQIGGCEIDWDDGEIKTRTHCLDSIATIYKRILGSEH